MKLKTLAAITLLATSFSFGAAQADSMDAATKMNIAICRGGALESANATAEFGREACADVKSKSEAICRAGALRSANATAEFGREACRDVRSESEAICRAGALASANASAEFGRSACKDLR